MKACLTGFLLGVCMASFSLAASAAMEVGLVGGKFGAIESKKIIEKVIRPAPGEIRYSEYHGFLPAADFRKYELVIIATDLERPYTAQEAEQIKNYVMGGGRLLLIAQSYRAIRESSGEEEGVKRNFETFESWLGKGRSYYQRNPVSCLVLRPDDGLLTGVFADNASPGWLEASVVLKNTEFENLVGSDEFILVGRKKVGQGVVYYLGAELFRMLLPNRPERHADAPGWKRILSNILLDSCSSHEMSTKPESIQRH